MAIYSIDDMKAYARQYEGRCMSKEFITTLSPLSWMCKRGHTWDAPFSIVRQGGWCVMCARENDKQIRFEKLKELVQAKGGRCIDKEYFRADVKMEFQCKFGHRWKTQPAGIKNGRWCPKCAGKASPTIEEIQQLARSNKGKLISKKYVNLYTPLRWECNEGHQWDAAYSNVKHSKTWCPFCYGNVQKSIEDIQKIAKSRGGKCLSKKYNNNRDTLLFECAKGHQWKTTAHMIISGGSGGTWCPKCSGKAPHTIDDMIELAKKKKGKCLSKIYHSTKLKIKWQCERGHIWESAPGNIIAGNWCPKCAIIKRTKYKDRVRFLK